MQTPQATLEEFRTALVDAKETTYLAERHSDHLLEQFLRARGGNVQKALDMFTACQVWRDRERVEEIRTAFVFEERERVSKLWPRIFHGTDKQGRPVLYNLHNRLDANKLFAITTEERLINSFIREQEKLTQFRFPAASTAAGKRIDQVVLVLDCAGYPYFQFHRIAGIVQNITRISSDYYPESLGKIIIINAPLMFPTIWAIAGKFFDEKTREKIQIVGANYLPVLEKDIAVQNIPDFLQGGQCRCKEGCELSDKGPWKDFPFKDLELWDFAMRDKQLNRDSAISVKSNFNLFGLLGKERG